MTTYTDYLKDDEGREINHHGAPRNVGEELKEDGLIEVTPALDGDISR